ncbi:MAG: hypothetical protein CSA64_04340 [Arachnia propionica]|nr:MAG: hypothetical protein CSA64_04340 [Arachnia propionica]
MGIIVLTGATGSPGVTTTALALALAWPTDVLLADCNRAPDQYLFAGFLRGMSGQHRGLGEVTNRHRQQQFAPADLLDCCVPLTEPGEIQRSFLPGFVSLGAVQLFELVWPTLADAFAELSKAEVDVIIDAGRIQPAGLPPTLLACADQVAVVTRSSLTWLASLRLYLPALREQLEHTPASARPGLLVVDPDRPYSHREIAAQFGLPVWGQLPRDDKSALALAGEAELPGRSRLLARTSRLAAELRQQWQLERELNRQVVTSGVSHD